MNATSPASRLSWYAHRVARMSPAEVAWRTRDQVFQAAWSRRQVTREQLVKVGPPSAGRAGTEGSAPSCRRKPPRESPAEAKAAVLASADRLMRGEWEVLGVVRTDMVQPDWFRDPADRPPVRARPLRLSCRSPLGGRRSATLSRSGRSRACSISRCWRPPGSLPKKTSTPPGWPDHLRSWWQENPFLSGIHWTSGIELGVRLISLVWIRRLLDDWPDIADLFERDGLALRQIHWHQQYLAAFPSRGSSANNHVIAEAAGQLVASCAFPWFPESERWRRKSARLLERELIRNTFPSGIGRELASDYQCFVAELGFLAAVEAEANGHPLSAKAWERLCAMADSAAALVDERLRPPRQGDSDEGRALLLDRSSG